MIIQIQIEGIPVKQLGQSFKNSQSQGKQGKKVNRRNVLYQRILKREST